MDFKSAMQAFAEAWTAANGFQKPNSTDESVNKSSDSEEKQCVENENEKVSIHGSIEFF